MKYIRQFKHFEAWCFMNKEKRSNPDTLKKYLKYMEERGRLHETK